MKDDGFTSINKVTGLKSLISPRMKDEIRKWAKAYLNTSDWLNKDVKSLNISSTIASEVARLVTLENEIKVTGSVRADYIDSQLDQFRNDEKNIVEMACAYGGMVFKPYLSNDKIIIDYVFQDEIYPFRYDGNRNITGIIFPSFVFKKDRVYTRLEIHDFKPNDYSIQNRAFVSKNTRLYDGMICDIGTEISLKDVEEWKDIEPDIHIEGLERPLFSYFKIPIANNIDRNSPLGVSVFARGIDEIERADIHVSRIDWEYESKETAIDVDDSYIEEDIYGNKMLPKGKERLFRMYASESMSGEKGIFQYYSPEIRDQSFFNGLDKILKRIEYKCNLAYGTISDPNNVDKTAEEIKSSKQRSYQLVSDIQKSLQNALEQLISTLDDISDMYSLTIPGDYDMSFKWDDSIIIDAEKEKMQDMQEVINGLLPAWKYKMKWQGLTEEQAKAETADNQNGIDF